MNYTKMKKAELIDLVKTLNGENPGYEELSDKYDDLDTAYSVLESELAVATSNLKEFEEAFSDTLSLEFVVELKDIFTNLETSQEIELDEYQISLINRKLETLYNNLIKI